MIRLVRWKEKVTEDGALYIKRETMRGPEPIEAFDIRKPKEMVEYMAKLRIEKTKGERETRAAFREDEMYHEQ